MDTVSRSLHALEFHEVLHYLAGFTVSDTGFQACLSLRPLNDIEAIRKEALLFEEGRLWLIKNSKLLVAFPPIHELWEVKESASFSPEQLWALRHTMQIAMQVRDSFINDKEPWASWQSRVEEMATPSSSLSALTRCLSDDGLIKDSASPELSLIRSELRGLHRQCTTRVKEYATQYNIMHFLQDDFMTLSSDRYVLPLKSNFKGRLQGVVHDYSQTGETCYFEPMFLVEINNKIQSLKREEREEERKILLYISSLVRDEMPAIQEMYIFLVDLDVLNAKASLAECYDGRLILLEPNERVHLREATHPLLSLSASEVAAKALVRSKQFLFKQASYTLDNEEDRDALDSFPQVKKRDRKITTVASTLELKEGQHALIISGGNAGGKTVCLKTLGLIALMSRCVLPCPVQAGSSLPFWKNVHAFIGDEQSLEDHVSTFTGQIAHLASIWENLGSDDIVILDEFGAGTDPSQGAALAQAVIGCIMERGAFAIAATHFPALKAYALSTEGVRSASVLFDPKTKKPLFKLVYEQVGASQALEVAREHGLPEEVLARAEQYLLLTGEDTNSLVERLNTLAVEREAELLTLQKKQASLDEKRKKLEEKYEKDRKGLFEKVQSDIQLVMEEWKKSRITHKQALKQLGEVKREMSGSAQKEETTPLDMTLLSLGDTVKHTSWGRVGQLQEIDTRKKRVRISMDGVTMWAKIEDLTLPDGQQREKSKTAQNTSLITASNISHSLQLDLRGKRADIAITELEKFLDTSILQGRYEVEIVHGKGTGVLRRELHSFLKSFPAVSQFRLAPENMGGDGMTIVELK